MPVEIVQRPRKTLKSGNNLTWCFVNNPCIYKWSRKDSGFISIVSGPGLTVQLNVGVDITSSARVGDAIYVQSDDGIYADGGFITALTPTTINTTIPFVQNTGSGYFNYKRSWFLEIRIKDLYYVLIIAKDITAQSSPAWVV